jgi:hypothetical protein
MATISPDRRESINNKVPGLVMMHSYEDFSDFSAINAGGV